MDTVRPTTESARMKESVLDLILSLKEARELKKPVPYSYTLGSHEKKIFVLGMAHFKPPTDPQFSLMKEKWTEFEELPEPKVVFVENYLPPITDTFEQGIEGHGEIGAAAWLARSKGYELVVADLDSQELTKRLSEKYGIDEVAYHYIMYTVWNQARKGKPTTPDDVIKGIRNLVEPLGLSISRGWFDALQERLFPGVSFDDEFLKTSQANDHMEKLITESARIRNIRAMEMFQEYWSKGYSIYIAYGANHSWEWEPALRKLASVE